MNLNFYHFHHPSISSVLIRLLEKAFVKTQCIIVQCACEETLDLIDQQLWVGRDDLWLPHEKGSQGQWKKTSQDYIWLTQENMAPDRDDMFLFLIKGAINPYVFDYQRSFILVDAHDKESIEHSRNLWKQAKKKDQGQCSYYQLTLDHKWVRQEH